MASSSDASPDASAPPKPQIFTVRLTPDNEVALERYRARRGLRSLNAAVNQLIERAKDAAVGDVI